MNIYTEFELSFLEDKSIKIPTKIHKSINYIDKQLLLDINDDIEIAKELCLLFCYLIIPSVIPSEQNINRNFMYEYSSRVLQSLFNNKYTKIIKALEIGTPDKGSIIVVNKSYKEGDYCRQYGFTELYRKGVQLYTLINPFVIKINRQNRIDKLNKNKDNIIVNNLYNFYKHLDMPSYKEVEDYGKLLAKQKKIDKKGRIITLQHRHDKSYWKDCKNRVFVEDALFVYNYLYTLNGLALPTIGSENSGYRVYDSLNMMTSWVRDLFKYDGEDLVELDYKCLHPNLAMNIYEGSNKYITHYEVAKYLDKDINKVKKEHLSFFNVETKLIDKYSVYNYYKNDKRFIDALYEDKKVDYKLTSKKMLKLEVDIMTDVIKQLNEKEIYIAYIFDAVLCRKKDKSIVTKIMNETIIKYNVYTSVDGTIISETQKPSVNTENTDNSDIIVINKTNDETNITDIDKIRYKIVYEKKINIDELKQLKKYLKNYRNEIDSNQHLLKDLQELNEEVLNEEKITTKSKLEYFLINKTKQLITNDN